MVSQTPLAQVSVAAAGLHVPSSVGLVCGASVGIEVPLVSVAVQVCAPSLHQLPAGQSASTKQAPAGMQLPFELQRPDRQAVTWLAAVQGPSPSA